MLSSELIKAEINDENIFIEPFDESKLHNGKYALSFHNFVILERVPKNNKEEPFYVSLENTDAAEFMWWHNNPKHFNRILTLRPGRSYLLVTKEKIATMGNIYARFEPNETATLHNLQIGGAITRSPGSVGHYVFTIRNNYNSDIKLSANAHILDISFYRAEGEWDNLNVLNNDKWDFDPATNPEKIIPSSENFFK